MTSEIKVEIGGEAAEKLHQACKKTGLKIEDLPLRALTLFHLIVDEQVKGSKVIIENKKENYRKELIDFREEKK